ncbi:MAG TPA: hypothetical protein ENJ19_09560, partial [Gammaproteobacteria bacterium]|nr:hypothetical protein [Gammaproteobacteria bacterium]
MTVPQEQATMVALSPGEGDFYAFHLAQLNQSNPVRLAADVFNHKGVMLAPKGTALDKAAADKLLSHQLARPLEQTVDVAGVLDNAELYAETRTILRRYPDLYQLHIALRFESDLKATLIDMDIHPWVLQQLTVLKQCLPQWF